MSDSGAVAVHIADAAAECGISLVASLPDGWITPLILQFAVDSPVSLLDWGPMMDELQAIFGRAVDFEWHRRVEQWSSAKDFYYGNVYIFRRSHRKQQYGYRKRPYWTWRCCPERRADWLWRTRTGVRKHHFHA